jgi:hypothetical protein
MTTPNTNAPAVAEPPARVEIRIPVDGTEAPIAFEDSFPDATDLAVELAGPAGLLATLVLPIGTAREWAGELFAAVSVAYREITGDPHALSDYELASLPPANSYNPGPGVMLVGEIISTGGLRAAIVEALAEHFNVAHVGVSAGEPLAGRPL